MEINEVLMTYGLQSTCVALVVILIIGIIKVIFKKRLDELGSGKTKPIYESLSIILAYGLTASWIALAVYVFHLRDDVYSWDVCIQEGTVAYAVVKVLYPLYENYHVRDFLAMIGKAIVSIFTKKKASLETTSVKATVNETVKPVESKKKTKTSVVMLQSTKATVQSSAPEPRIVSKTSDIGQIK